MAGLKSVMTAIDKTDWSPPLFPVKFMLFLGSLLLLLQGIVWFIRDLHMAFTGRKLE